MSILKRTYPVVFSAIILFQYSCGKKAGVVEEIKTDPVVVVPTPEVKEELTEATTVQRAISSPAISANLADYTANSLYNFYYSTDNNKRTLIQYRVGSLKCPIIISSPHGVEGDVLTQANPPFWASWKDKTDGTMVSDNKTTQLAEEISEAFYTLTGLKPHLIINQIHRSKLDPNQPVTNLDANAANAFYAFHRCLDVATDKVDAAFPETGGLLVDIHGHGHTDANGNALRIVELGYNFLGTSYTKGDAYLNTYYKSSTMASINNLTSINPATNKTYTFAERLRGTNSLGDLFQAKGINSTPSPANPDPVINDNPYFVSGQIAQLHGSLQLQRKTSAIHIEFNHGVKNTDAIRKANGKLIAEALIQYLKIHYQINLAKI